MIIKNLFRRKGRTLLTMAGIAIGVLAVIILGALADGLKSGYGSMMSSSKADLVLSQPDQFDISYSTVKETVGPLLANMPEVDEISGMLQGITQAENEPLFIVFGYGEDSFMLERFKVIEGFGLYDHTPKARRGTPIMLGSVAAEVMKKSVGDTIRLTSSAFRIIGIYETGDAFEDSGALLRLVDAQSLLGKERQVSLYYIRLKDTALRPRLEERARRTWPELALTGTSEFTDKQSLQTMLQAFVWIIGGLAIVIGGVGMMNAQLMSVFERTREIGVLRAVGWSRGRVLWMILGESIVVCLLGGLAGLLLGWLGLLALSKATVVLGVNTTNLRRELLIQSLLLVLSLGLVAGVYPAWRAARLTPLEALRYEGGSSSKVHRLPFGGLAVQGLWQRSTRTLLTFSAVGLTVGAIMAIDGMVNGFLQSFTDMAFGTQAEIMLRQADVADTTLSAIDERVGDQIAAMPQVRSINGAIFTGMILPGNGAMFVLQGYEPGGFAIRRFKVVEGKPLTANRQILLGRLMANSMKKGVGDTLELTGIRFKIVGIYESNVGWEQMGGVTTLRDAQNFVGRPRKVGMYAVKLVEPSQAAGVVEQINARFPGIYAATSGEFASQMPDMKSSNAMLDAISFMAILVGGVGILNTMLMSVMERTREIGVLRALGWRKRAVMGLILREALLVGLLGGLAGIFIAFGLSALMQADPTMGNWVVPAWTPVVFLRAIAVALLLGVLGGLYPAYRATRLPPVEALRYE
jgi:ABC-type antimicrobial peptide transport system permease subunit